MKRASVAAMMAMCLASGVAFGAGVEYPETRKADTVLEIGGHKVADPYQWLENDVRENEEVAAWVKAQNQVTFGLLDEIGSREHFRNRLTELMDYERYSSPSKVAEYYVFSKNDGLQNQSVVYVQDSLTAEPRVLLDPNTWSEKGTISLAGMSFSDSGDYVAFAKSSAGSDWSKWHVMNVRTGEMLPDVIEWTKFTGASWTLDNKGFYYTRFPEPKEGEAFQQLNLNAAVYYHKVGTPQSEDVRVFDSPENPEWGFGAGVTEDGNFLLISGWKGTDNKNLVWVKDLRTPEAAPMVVVDNWEHEWNYVANDEFEFYFMTDKDAPRKRVVKFDIRKGPSALAEVIPQSENTLQGAGCTGNMLVASYLKDVLPQVRMYAMDGTHVRDVQFPGLGSGGGFGGERKHTETFYGFSSFNVPPSIYRYDMVTGKSELFRTAKVDFNPDDFEVKQVFYSSKDGTRVPMFIVHKKGIKLDGTNPTLLYGYGGFNISLTAGFSPTRIAWLEQGGVFAQANLRGGGEYGNEWHEAGKKANKQNVFDDFIAAAEWLIDTGYTKPEKLAIMGGSNGGLLVGAAMTQRPDLFGAALPIVGVMDMLQFHKWTAGRYWVDDYGCADNAEDFEFLKAYSPYHNLKEGVEYPATMVITADTDDRVVPGHSFKFAARLQEAHTGSRPVVIRIQTDAGHGAGKPTSKVIEETADMWGFLAENLQMPVTPTN
jgi:prolyl oligopeptidase